ncbi:MAG TPA: DNA polymerase ligase N-terminal domain-containing protein [Methanoregulaceae archaeon]|nr:DNA polymerase ligase N-terminal domain-containing protein [Methanoregulaceae archaeon]
MSLENYTQKRNFIRTPEPVGHSVSGGRHPIFVIQEHTARHHHFDLRLERDGVLKSWAVPKDIPKKSGEKRLAVATEDHPLEYADFEGTIPEGEYGAGRVSIWDQGIYETLLWEDAKIEVVMKGERVSGRYVLVRFKKQGDNDWLILKAKD